MKLGIIGTGSVGAATAMSVALSGACVSELILLNRNRARARAVATDMRYGAPLSSPIKIADGDYNDLADARLVIVTAGVNEKAGGATDRNDAAGRLRLLGPNMKIFETIIPQVVAAAPGAPILVVTDPPDPLIEVARRLAGDSPVFGAGTYLDTLRFRVHLSQRLGVSARSIDAAVIGEHGTSSVFLWSTAQIGGVPIAEWLAQKGIAMGPLRHEVEQEVRYANIRIIEGIGASQYGIGMVAARLAKAVIRDERVVLPVGSYIPQLGTALSLPAIVGSRGACGALFPEMTALEREALENSAAVLRQVVAASCEQAPDAHAPDKASRSDPRQF